MKKLMVAAVAAAMTGAVFAEAQVYTATLTVKTTLCKEGKFTKSVEKFLGAGYNGLKVGDSVGYRQKATKKINGVFWGCDCTTIANPQWGAKWNAGKKQAAITGYAFWDATGKEGALYPVYRTDFKWLLLNRVGQMNGVEGTWVLANKAVGTAFQFWGAGFGSPKGNWDCDAYISSINGNFAGWMIPNALEGDGCVFCGEDFDDCLVEKFCICCWDPNWKNITAAYGTWTIKYNSSVSTQMRKCFFITDATKLKWTSKMLKPVAAELEQVRTAINNIAKKGGYDFMTGKDEEKAADYKADFKEVTNAQIEAELPNVKDAVVVEELSAKYLPAVAQQYLHAEGTGEGPSGDDDPWGDDDDPWGDDDDDDGDDDIW